MAHSHAEYLEVRHGDGRDPDIYRDVSYTPHRDGVTVFVDGEQVEHRLSYAVVGEPEPVR